VAADDHQLSVDVSPGGDIDGELGTRTFALSGEATAEIVLDVTPILRRQLRAIFIFRLG